MTIQRREVAFDFKDVPRDWCSDDPYATTMLAALSMLFPEGEKFFVESVKQFKHVMDTPDVAGFIGQEAMHGREHRALNELLVSHGYTAAPKIDRRLRWFLKRVRHVLSPKSQLAVTCALEHFTAIMAERLLADERMRAEIHPSVRPLWLWHALEESEHKAVAFDVYRAAGGGYARRVAIMMLATLFFFIVQGLAQARLLAQRGVLHKPWTWLRGIRRLWIYPGHFLRLVPAYLTYYRPGFHPDDRDTTELLARWERELFDRRELRAVG
jgi:predicted metal-dependent hydrolase